MGETVYLLQAVYILNIIPKDYNVRIQLYFFLCLIFIDPYLSIIVQLRENSIHYETGLHGFTSASLLSR